MPEVAFDRFYRYEELTGILHAWAEESPGMFRLESIGTSFEGRDIWLATITNFERMIATRSSTSRRAQRLVAGQIIPTNVSGKKKTQM